MSRPVRTNRVTVLIALAAAAAGAMLLATFPSAADAVRERPGELATYLGLVLFLQLLSFEVYGRGSIGVSAIGMLATAFVFGPGPAAALAFAAAVVQWARRRGMLHRAVFDAANFSLASGTSGFVYEAIGGGASSAAVLLLAATAAAAAFATVNLGLLCLAMSISEDVPLRAVWNERFHWARFHFLAFGTLALALSLAYEELGTIAVLAFVLPPALVAYTVREYLNRTRSAVEEIRQANEDLVAANAELTAMAERLRRTHRDTIAALSRSMDAKDHDTGDHTERVASVAVALGHELGFRGDDLEAIEIGALLHDIGKIGMPEQILSKPGPLDDDEWAIMHTHPLISERILDAVDLHPFVCQIARSSHERFDGRGYPDGRRGEEIPLPARIVLVADAFDAITSARPYRPGRSVSQALSEIDAHAGAQFCPRVVAALAQLARTSSPVLRGNEAPGLRAVA